MAGSKHTVKAPAFQFYPRDFLSDSNQMAMSLQEAGAYIRLMCHCWDDGSIPDDPIRLARLVGTTSNQMRKLWPAIRHCFRNGRQHGRLVHPRLEKERVKQDNYRRRQSDAATKRWDKQAYATASPRHKPPHPHSPSTGNALLSSSSSATAVSPVKNTGDRRGAHPSDFAPEVLSRINAFIERYQALYEKHRNGAHYLVHPQKDFVEAGLLCQTWDDARLDRMATLWLTTDDPFAESGSRNLAQFRSRASWCDSRLRERGL